MRVSKSTEPMQRFIFGENDAGTHKIVEAILSRPLNVGRPRIGKSVKGNNKTARYAAYDTYIIPFSVLQRTSFALHAQQSLERHQQVLDTIAKTTEAKARKIEDILGLSPK